MLNVSRHALIIGSPGHGNRPLRGVFADIQEFPKFLQSANGGGFLRKEITVLSDPTFAQVKKTINTVKVDYFLLYYSGHGCMDSNGLQVIQLKDRLVSEQELYGFHGKVLAIFDACRDKAGPARISGFPWSVEKYLNFSGVSKIRDDFDQAIFFSAPGTTVVYATGDANSAYEDDQDGGYFTRSIFEAVIDAQRAKYKGWLSTQTVVEAAAGHLLQKDTEHLQVPQYIKRLGNLSVPFAFASPDLVIDGLHIPAPIFPQKNVLTATEKTLLLATGLLLTAGILSESDR